MRKKVFRLWANGAAPDPKSEAMSMQSKTEPETDDRVAAVEPPERDRGLWRDLTAYWMLGLCNNYGYVVMLTAAHDIIKELEGHGGDSDGAAPVDPTKRKCNLISTGAILLADILPSLFIKLMAPFLPFVINIRVVCACLFSIVGFVLVAIADSEWLALTGVAFTSLSSGLGEPTFLAYSAYFNKNVISTWSSGTGGAGIFGALSYSVLRNIGLSNKQTLLVMICVPFVEALVFFLLLRKPLSIDEQIAERQKSLQQQEQTDVEADVSALVTFKQKILFIPQLLKYMVPLTLVYLFEYFINQGLFELVYFKGISLDNSEQYRWYQVTYQVGVFISRSSVNVVHIKHIWLMAVLQLLNVVFFMFESIYAFVPSIWIIFAVILFEGLLGGGAYVNTFYRMSKEVPMIRREYAMSVVTMSDTGGIALAGFLSMPTHNWICTLPVPPRLQ